MRIKTDASETLVVKNKTTTEYIIEDEESASQNQSFPGTSSCH